MDTKPGVKTSEFWVTLAAVLAGFLNQKFGVALDPVSLAAIMGAVATYAWSRAKTKSS